MQTNDDTPTGLFHFYKKIQNVRLILILSCLFSFNLLANNGLIVGEVRNELTNEPIEFATVYIQGTGLGTTTDSLGIFRIELEAGVYNLEVAYLGFETSVLYSKPVSSAEPNYLQIRLSPTLTQLEEVKVLGKECCKSDIFRSDQRF